MTHSQLKEIILWTVDATKDLDSTDADGGMGLWQSFQAAFPKEDFEDYDLAVTAYSSVVEGVMRRW